MVRFLEARLIVLLIGLWHLGMGLIIIVVPPAMWITSLHLWANVMREFDLNGQAHFTLGMLLVISGMLAILAIADNKVPIRFRIGAVWPQQLVLILQFISIGSAVSAGMFPDGYRPQGDGGFILADQLLPLLASSYHVVWLLSRTTGLMGH